MNWDTIIPWAFTLLCPLGMLWCMRSMRAHDSCHAMAAAGEPNGDAAREIRQLKARLAAAEARQDFSAPDVAAKWGTRS